MPIMTLNPETKSFVWTDINELATLPGCNKVKTLCWGWGNLTCDPAKYYKEHHREKVFHVMLWLWLGGRGAKRRDVRMDISGVYAEGCQYLMQGDPIFFVGVLKYDAKYSNLQGFQYFIVDAHMVIPPYSADGREFCARKNAIIERQTQNMISQYSNNDTGEVVPGLMALEKFLKGEQNGSL